MARKIPELKKRIAYRLYKNEGLNTREITETLSMSTGATWVATTGRDRGYSSIKAHQDYLARQQVNPETGQNFIGHRDYEVYLAKQRINPQTGENFASHQEYSSQIAKKRRGRKENKAFSHFVRVSLEALGESTTWLAEQISTHPETVRKYIDGRQLPGHDVLRRLFGALEVPYRTIDDLMNDPNNQCKAQEVK